MSKKHISIKWIKNNFKKVYYCESDELNRIFKYFDPEYYNAGGYGWNCDVYINYEYDIAITTGYRNLAGYRIPDTLIEKYNKIAKNIEADSKNALYEEVIKAYKENAKNFWDELNKI